MDAGDSLADGCIIPLLQSAVLGVLITMLTIAVMMFASDKGEWYAALAAGDGAALLWWIGSIRSWRRSHFVDDTWYNPVDQEARIDPQPVRVEVTEDQGRRVTIADLPVSPNQLIELAGGLSAGYSFSEGSWSGPGAPFTRSEFRRLRDTFIARGWAEWSRPGAPSQGVQLSPAGRAVVRYFATSPTLPGDGRYPVQ